MLGGGRVTQGKTLCEGAIITVRTRMPMSLRFIYFGYQCPHNTYLLARIKTLAWRESIPLRLDDITEDPAMCEEFRIFSPTTLIVNDHRRLLGPFSKEDVLAMLYDEGVPDRETDVSQSEVVVEGTLEPVTPESVLSTCRPCLQSEDIGLCRGKAEWTKAMLGQSKVEHLGYLHLLDGRCVGGAEYLPSLRVPYPIPDKRDANAFLTCSFRSDSAKDYRTFPLERLRKDLMQAGYDTLSVVSSTRTTFPNGPVEWFERRGFEKREVLVHEDLPETDLVYMQLPL
jgi:hypothetical protein